MYMKISFQNHSYHTYPCMYTKENTQVCTDWQFITSKKKNTIQPYTSMFKYLISTLHIYDTLPRYVQKISALFCLVHTNTDLQIMRWQWSEVLGTYITYLHCVFIYTNLSTHFKLSDVLKTHNLEVTVNI